MSVAAPSDNSLVWIVQYLRFHVVRFSDRISGDKESLTIVVICGQVVAQPSGGREVGWQKGEVKSARQLARLMVNRSVTYPGTKKTLMLSDVNFPPADLSFEVRLYTAPQSGRTFGNCLTSEVHDSRGKYEKVNNFNVRNCQ